LPLISECSTNWLGSPSTWERNNPARKDMLQVDWHRKIFKSTKKNGCRPESFWFCDWLGSITISSLIHDLCCLVMREGSYGVISTYQKCDKSDYFAFFFQFCCVDLVLIYVAGGRWLVPLTMQADIQIEYILSVG
jgi:hypothetical protein